MKNNIRYKGNINNTSVIIFFNWRTKTPCDVTLLGRTSSEVFVMLVVVVHPVLFFIFLLLFLICRFSSFTFSFQHHPSPFRGLSSGFYTYFVLSAQPIAEWFATLSFSTIPLSPFRERYGLEWTFFTHRCFFTLHFFTNISPEFITASLGAGSSSLKSAGLHTDPRNSTGPSVCLVHSNAQSSYSERFIFKFYHILS